MSPLRSLSGGGLKRSTQHFISDARDGVDGDGPKICSRFQCGGERGVVGALATRGVAQGDWASVWQAVIIDLLPGGSAWRDSSSAAAAFTTGIDAEGARGDLARDCGGSIDTIDSAAAGPCAIDGEPRSQAQRRL